MNNTILETALRILKSYIDGRFNGNVAAAARELNINYITLNNWMAGDRSPSLSVIGPILDRLGVQLVEPIDDAGAYKYAYIPKVEAKAGAGASLETSGSVEGMYAFRRDWIASLGLQTDRLVMMDVVGDSMEPLISEGDTLLIDQRDNDPSTIRDGMIYIVTLGDELRCKRIQKGVTGFILHSENPRYGDIPVSGADLEQFIIWGRVRWCGRVF